MLNLARSAVPHDKRAGGGDVKTSRHVNMSETCHVEALQAFGHYDWLQLQGDSFITEHVLPGRTVSRVEDRPGQRMGAESENLH